MYGTARRVRSTVVQRERAVSLLRGSARHKLARLAAQGRHLRHKLQRMIDVEQSLREVENALREAAYFEVVLRSPDPSAFDLQTA